MQKRQLGTSDLLITSIGFGSWAIGGSDWAFSWGSQDDRSSIAAIRRAVERGINWIDTAAIYGYGHSEEIVGRALKEIGSSQRPYVFTKCGLHPSEGSDFNYRLRAESIRQEVEGSLRRLSVDVIDLYQIHWPIPEQEIVEGWQTLIELQREGKVRHIGVSNFSVNQLKQIQAIAPVTSLQPPYSLLSRTIEAEILPFCEARQIGVIVYSPMASGLLSGAMTAERVASLPDDDWRKLNPAFNAPELQENLRLVDLLANVGQRHHLSAGAVAIAWTLRNPVVTGAIVGVRNPTQIDGLVGAADFRLSAGEVAEIEQFLETHPVSQLRMPTE